MLWTIKTLWVYAASLRRKAYCTYPKWEEKKNSEREERKEKGEVGVGRGTCTAPAPWSLGLSVGHMNPLTCKLLVAVN